MKLLGRPTINPLLFITGKVSGYALWIILLLHLSGFNLVSVYSSVPVRYLAYILTGLGSIIILLSLINLGDSTSLGIPSEKTTLKTRGLYRYSRNPMYVGFNIFTIASVLITSNIICVIVGMYSIIVYHLIILGEERYLQQRFKNLYSEYCKKVGRYI